MKRLWAVQVATYVYCLAENYEEAQHIAEYRVVFRDELPGWDYTALTDPITDIAQVYDDRLNVRPYVKAGDGVVDDRTVAEILAGEKGTT